MSIDNYVNGMSEGSQRRGSVKDKVYKRPVSILVVIYAQDTKRVLMLQRRDDPDFWQSVTGSVEEGETAPQAAMREVKEEVTIDVVAEQLTLIDCQRTVEFEIIALIFLYEAAAHHNLEYISAKAVLYAAAYVGLVLLIGEGRKGFAHRVEIVRLHIGLVYRLEQFVELRK